MGWICDWNVNSECFQMCASVCSMIETHSLAKSQHGIAMQPVTPSDTVALLWSVVCQNSAIMWSQSTIMHLQLYVLTWHGYVDREAGIEWKYQPLWSSGRSTWFNKVLHHMTFNGALTIQVIFSFRNALPAGPIKVTKARNMKEQKYRNTKTDTLEI